MMFMIVLLYLSVVIYIFIKISNNRLVLLLQPYRVEYNTRKYKVFYFEKGIRLILFLVDQVTYLSTQD